MSKLKSNIQSSDVSSSSAAAAGTGVLSVLSLLESLALAITLALIIRGFVVEAFVIPTGSMAESLLGRHTENVCKTCRYNYTTGVPLAPGTNRVDSTVEGRPLTCPNCGDESVRLTRRDSLVRAGDRVLVLKPMYFLSRYKPLRWLTPKRWDVVVFLYPGSGRDNYIKRLAGLPGETIEIIDGDIYLDGRIAQKPQKVQQELWIDVFDNDYQRPHPGQGWPRWQAEVDSSYIDRLHGGRLLRINADAGERFVAFNRPIDNSLSYNALGNLPNHVPVTDLRLAFDVIPSEIGPSAQVTAVLSKRDDYFRLRLDLSDRASPYLELQHALGVPAGSGHGQWQTVRDDAGRPLRYDLPPVVIGGSLHLALQNVDYQVSVWLDGCRVLATSDRSYSPGSLNQVRLLGSTSTPSPRVFISARDCQVDLLHIKLDRDVYYTSTGQIMLSYEERFLADAQADAQAFNLDRQPPHACGRPFHIPSDADPSGSAYFMLGDNSSYSRDSRLWAVKHSGLDDDYVRGTVPRSHMIGQAFFVYWPAAGPLVGRQLPLVPRVGKMRLIH